MKLLIPCVVVTVVLFFATSFPFTKDTATAKEMKMCACEWVHTVSDTPESKKWDNIETFFRCKGASYYYEVNCPNEKIVTGYKVSAIKEHQVCVSADGSHEYVDTYHKLDSAQCCSICSK